LAGRLLRVSCLPVGHGDSILVEYGERRRPFRVLIDGGPANHYEVLQSAIGKLPADERRLELLVVSHVDADHIDGTLIMLQDPGLGISFDDVWFNGWPQLATLATDMAPDVFAPKQGEFLGALLHDQQQPWNRAFEGGKCILVPDTGPLPVRKLPGGATLTLLSPSGKQLRQLRKSWVKALKEAGMKPGDFDDARERLAQRKEYKPKVPAEDVFAPKRFASDSSVANGGSIAFVLEFEGRRVLLGADAFSPVLTAALRRLAAEEGVERVPLDAVKLPHHGSMANIDKAFLDAIESSCFLVATNGDHFKHPDPQTIRLIGEQVPQAEVRFNQRSATTETWVSAAAQQAASIRAVYPPEGQILELTT
jgi:beta-lactamase superfamily II metal-dependent hydrolase